jgi:hypothetical protein
VGDGSREGRNEKYFFGRSPAVGSLGGGWLRAGSRKLAHAKSKVRIAEWCRKKIKTKSAKPRQS